MTYFLDTNICIYFLKGKNNKILKNIQKLNPSEIKIPSVVKGELLLGALKSQNSKRTMEAVKSFLFPFEIIPFDDSASEIYSNIRFILEKSGKTIGPNNFIIASIALSRKGFLVTNNEKEFKRIPGLKIRNWTR
ncbi:type II toxin-antitoxin system VapC family toxin [candidate division WOR-3 bacterium]|nr:type II toxin-antitoxin system VapC family toxin [candidate division WOR-3 bacterium]